MKSIVDNSFGKLKLVSVDYWEGTLISKKFGEVRLALFAGALGPTEDQRQCLDLFKSNEAKLFTECERALYKHYIAITRYAKANPFPFIGINLAKIKKQQEIWSQLIDPFTNGTTIEIPRQPHRGSTMEIAWNCTWDEENGIKLEIVDGKVQELWSR